MRLRGRLRDETGWALVTAMLVLLVMIGVGLATLSFVDSDARVSGGERNRESAYDYGEGVLDTEGYIISAQWPSSSALAYPDCTYNGATVTAAGGTRGTAGCPSPTQLAQAFATKEYKGPLNWTARIRDNGGTEKCALTGQNQCSDYYDDNTFLTGQPAWDANGDGQVWVRAQAIMWGKRRTVVERMQLDKQAVDFPQAVITADHLRLKDSPHIKVVTNYSPINLRCDGTTQGCLVVKKQKQIAPYRITFGYKPQQAVPTSILNLLRQRAKNEGWYYASCPTNPPGSQVFVESGSCTGASLPYTTPATPGTYIQATGTLTISGKQPNSAAFSKGRKGNYWGLIYMANSSKISSDVVVVKSGRRLIRGVVAIDWTGGFNLGGSKDTLLEYDPFAIQGLYLYQGSTVVRPSFREISTTQP